MQENQQQDPLSNVESNPRTAATECQPIKIQSGDTNEKCDTIIKENNMSNVLQMTSVKQEESCTTTTSGQILTCAMPALYPELLNMPNCGNFSTVLYTGQTPVNTLDTKLAGLFTIPPQFRSPLTLVAPIVKGAMQPTRVTSTRTCMESPVVMSNMYSSLPIAPSSLPSCTKVTKFVI